MAQEQNTTVEVQPGDTIDSLLQRLVGAGARNVSLVIPSGAPVPSTLPEFEQLRELERKARLHLTMVVDPRDRTRFGLAKILSFNVRTSDTTPAEATFTPAAPAEPLSAPPTSRISEAISAPPLDEELPPDIAGMNFDEDELAAAMPNPPSDEAAPIHPRIIGGDQAQARPLTARERIAARRHDAAPPSGPSPYPTTTTGKLKLKMKTNTGSFATADEPTAEAAPAAPPRRQPRFTAAVPPLPTVTSSDERAAAPMAATSYPTTTTGKIKMKAKTLGGPAPLDEAAIAPEPVIAPPITIADTEPIIPADTGLGIPSARRLRREPPPPPAAAVTPTPSANTMKVKIKTNNGEWTSDGVATDRAATPVTAAPGRSPSQSKTAAAVAIAPPRTITTTRPPRTDAETLRRERERNRLIWLAASIVLLLLLVGVGGYYLLNALNTGTPPSATVSLTAKTISVSQQVSVPISVNGQALLVRSVQADFRASPSSRLFAPTLVTSTLTGTTSVSSTLPTLPDHSTAPPLAAQIISVTVTQSGTIATSGVRQEPRGNDVTQLKIVNPNSFAVTIAAGSRVPGGNTQFYFPEAVTVPGSNLLANVIGTSYVDVTAVQVGPTGVTAYSMSGVVSSLQYQNTNKATGATLVDIPIVSEADYNSLVGGLIAKANALIPDQINAQVGNRVLITQTITTDGDPQTSTDHKVGDVSGAEGQDNGTLSATVTRTAHAYAFNPQDASQAAITALEQSITSTATNVALDPASVKIDAGQLQKNGDNSYVYQASASASGSYVIDQTTLNGVRDMLVGRKASDSVATLRQSILARYPTLADVQIQISPGSGNNDGVLPSGKVKVTTSGNNQTPSAKPTP